MTIPNHGVFVVGRFAVGGGEGNDPKTRLAAWRKRRLLGDYLIDEETTALIDELDSELLGSKLEVRAASPEAALIKMQEMGLSVEESQIRKVRERIDEEEGEDGLTRVVWQQLTLRGELGPNATVNTLLNLLRQRHKEGQVYLVQRNSPKNGTVSVRGYLPDYDCFAELFEGFARAVASLAAFGGEGWAVFVADRGLTDPPVFHRIEAGTKGTRLHSFDPDEGGKAEYEAVAAKDAASDSALEKITEGYAVWLREHEEQTRGQRWAGRAGYLRAEGGWLVEPSFGEARPFCAGRAAFRDDRWKWGYLDEQGQVVVAPQFFEAGDFQEGLARVRVETDRVEHEHTAQVTWRCGFIEPGGAWRVEPRFGEAEHFFESRAAVRPGSEDDDAWGYIDPQGELVCEPRWRQVFQFQQGRALVSEGRFDDGPKRYGFIDPGGELVIPLVFESAGHFQEGLALAYRDGKWGHIDLEGRWVIEPTFERGGYFQDGRAIMIDQGKRGIINPEGRWVVHPQYGWIQLCGSLYEVRVDVSASKGTGCVDRDGNVVVPVVQAEVRNERSGLIPVRPEPGGPWGYMNLTGEWVIEPRFAEAFEAGIDRAIVALDDNRWAIIDHAGEIQVEYAGWITDASHFSTNGVAWVARQASYGLVRSTGDILIDVDADLEHIHSFGDSILCVRFRSA